MADSDLAALRFLPWVRQGAAAALKDGGAVEMKLVVNGKPVTVPMRLIGPGSVQKAEVRVQNYRPSAMKMEVSLIAPAEWRITPETLTFEVPAKSHAHQSFTITVPKNWEAPAPRVAIAADVRADGKYLGQITEAVVDLQ